MTLKKTSKINRRTFLALTGGTGAGLVFQSQEKYIHKLIPYVNAPQYPKPGEWAYYLSACRECPAGCGLMMWYRDGRVTKAEGNPENPINSGKLCIRGQSSVLGQYDTDRVKNPLVKNGDGKFTEITWDKAFQNILLEMHDTEKVAVVSNLQTGSLAGVMEDFAGGFGQKPLYYEAFSYEAMRKANAETYGQALIPKYNLEESDLIISFGADFLETWISPVEYAREFSKFHSLKNNRVNKFIYFGPARTMTAVNSDEFILTEPGTEMQIIAGLMKRLGRINTTIPENGDRLPAKMNEKLDRIAEELRQANKPVILAGNGADKSVAGKMTVKAANQLNEFLGNQAVDIRTSHALSKTAMSNEVREFFESVDENTILVIHNTNPVFSEPDLEKYITKAKAVVYIGPMQNETAALARWILPSNYYFEDWGDYEAWNGTVSLLQPVMRPIDNTKSAGDIFLALHGLQEIAFEDVVKQNWRKWSQQSSVPQENENAGENKITLAADGFLQEVLQKGYLNKPKEQMNIQAASGESENTEIVTQPAGNRFFLKVFPSHYFYDGSLANRGWLQEIPHPVSNIVWQSWIDMNSEKAKELDIEEGDILKITSGDRNVEVAVRLTEDIDKNTLAMDAGQGHTHLGLVANGVGVNAFKLLQESASGSLPEVTVEKTGNNEAILFLNFTKDQHDRELLQHVELEKIRDNTAKTEEMNWPMPEGYDKADDLYKGHEHKDHRWGMVIDLQSCIGCKACEAACYAENNIQVVGKENCREGREMSWLKVPPYDLTEKKQTAYLPTPCQHCDSAPCEPVCPVYASVHTEEGLNAQIYNRCIGTRYCSNNCPYKVRRFNWVNIKYDFPMTLQLNPEVTVRERGVMEKCTFCVQRIRNKEYQAKTENRKLKDGEIVPACAQTCPTNAIVFGDLMDENSEVRKLIKDKRKYQLLNELNTKTAVVYLKKITV